MECKRYLRTNLSLVLCELFFDDLPPTEELVDDGDNTYGLIVNGGEQSACGPLEVHNGTDITTLTPNGQNASIQCDSGFIANVTHQTCNGGQFAVNPTICFDIDECLEDPCLNGGTCNNLVNSYSCDCPTDIRGENCEQDGRCIVLIGGYKSSGVPAPGEFYHPTAECNVSALTSSSLLPAGITSGCFLREAQQIVLRETNHGGDNRPPIVYQLTDGTHMTLPLAYSYCMSSSCYGSTSALAVGGVCLSCGVFSYNPSSSFLNECYVYSPSNATWSPIANLPYDNTHAASTSLGDDYYVSGGYDNGNSLMDKLPRQYGFVPSRVLRLQADQHHVVAALLFTNVYGTPAGFSSDYYARCEYDHVNASTAQLTRYNTVSGQWYAETPMASARAYHGFVALSSTELMACGGEPGARRDCDVYNATSRQWTTQVANMTVGRRAFSMVDFGGDLYALGGVDPEGVRLDSVERYDRATNTWTPVAKPMKSPRHFQVGLYVNVNMTAT